MKTRKDKRPYVDAKGNPTYSALDARVNVSEHTPTPWKAWSETGGGYGMYLKAANGDTVAKGVIRDDAAFIVRAVNSHEMLVEALNQAIERLRKLNQPVIGLELVIEKAEGR